MATPRNSPPPDAAAYNTAEAYIEAMIWGAVSQHEQVARQDGLGSQSASRARPSTSRGEIVETARRSAPGRDSRETVA